ncbi:MAG: thermonuclease family protein [Gemmatimonadota bacterium]
MRVRLIGIDAPENSQGADGAKAKAALTKLMPAGQPVRLQFDRRREDQYGRLLAYGWSGATLVNEAMVAGGWTLAGIYPPNVMYTRRLEAAEESARERKAGMWATGGFSCRPADRRGRRC